MQDNEEILNRLIAEGKARNWQDEPGTTITIAEALRREAVAKAEKTIQDILREEKDTEVAYNLIEGEYHGSLASIIEAPEHADYHEKQGEVYGRWLDQYSREGKYGKDED